MGRGLKKRTDRQNDRQNNVDFNIDAFVRISRIFKKSDLSPN